MLIDDTTAGPGGLPIKRLSNGELQIGNAIFAEDVPQFQAMPINRLALVASTVAGMRVLLSIDASGRTLWIEELTGDNSFAGADDWEDCACRGFRLTS